MSEPSEATAWEARACEHPRVQIVGTISAACRLEVRLNGGKIIEVCRLCWQEIPR